MIVLLTSVCIGFLKKNNAYYIFAVLTFLKIALNLQIFNYSQILQSLGFDRVGTSVFIIITLYYQFQFFKLYFGEKVPRHIPIVVLLILIFDFSTGYLFQGHVFYFLSAYTVALYLVVLFLKDLFGKIKILKRQDYPFIGIQLFVILTLIILVLKFWVNIYDNFFREHDFVLLYWSSLMELLVYLAYLFVGMINLNKEYIKKSKALVHSQNAIIETQENERQRLAQDLHDDLGATLAMLNSKGKKEEFSVENQSLIEKAIKDLRSISRNLLPADFEAFGLISSIEKYLKSLNEQQTVAFTFINFGERRPLKHETELNIYRIVTELSNNVMKHSRAKNATVQLIYHTNHLFVSVEDDGKGLEISQNNLGIGLKNVISRIEYLQAKVLELGTGPSCSFVFEVPYEPHKR